MRLIVAWFFSMLLLIWASACTAPPPTEEQLRAYAEYAQSRATDAAAAETIAVARATEAAAVQQIAEATAAAVQPSLALTATATLTPSEVITTTMQMTVTGEIVAGTDLLMATVEISPTVEPVATVVVTPTLTLTPTLQAVATATPTIAVVATATPTIAVVATATPTIAVVATATPTIAVVATATPTPRPPASPIASSPWAALFQSPGGQAAAALIPRPTATVPPTGQVTVSSQQANLRGGPGTIFNVVATTRQGAVLDVFGRDAAQNWWQVCCVDGEAGWISSTIVRFQGDAQAVPVLGPLLPDDLSASWAMRWECRGRGCKQDVCTGQSQAAALRVINDRWLEVRREATWDDNCGEPEEWLAQVDRYTGRERQTAATAPLFAIWQGANPGPANRRVELAGATLNLWCTDTRTQEVPQSGGWTATFEGQACYDVESGILALMQYVKRWLFSGTASGQTFDRQYFGDYEIVQQVLLGTNAPLSGQ